MVWSGMAIGVVLRPVSCFVVPLLFVMVLKCGCVSRVGYGVVFFVDGGICGFVVGSVVWFVFLVWCLVLLCMWL